MKYKKKQILFGKWQPIPAKVACCDCGLVHNWKFRIKLGVIEYQVTENKKLTQQIRKEHKFIKQ